LPRFRFDAPPMSPDDWEQFGRHLKLSAVHFEQWCRMMGTAGVRDIEAVIRGMADTIAAAPPGGPVPVMRIALNDTDQKHVRAVLSKSLLRAGDESPSGDRPGHSEAARVGVGALLDQWESFIRYRDPLTGRRARIRVLSTGEDEED
jgi:hypothetical protein